LLPPILSRRIESDVVYKPVILRRLFIKLTIIIISRKSIYNNKVLALYNS
jgi:hypothetical protein